MRTQLRIFSSLGIFLLLAVATSYGQSTWTVAPSGAQYTSVQAAINAGTTLTGDVVQLVAGNIFTETVTLSKAITLEGADTTAKIHGSITVSAGGAGAKIQSLVVYGSSGDGISANGINGLTLTSVVSRGNAGSGTQFTNCSNVTVNGTSIFSNNSHEGFNTLGGSNYTLNTVTANSNTGSGVDIDNVTGTSSLTSTTATNNLRHGVSVSAGSANVTITGGTFTGNGTTGDATTGGGINIDAEGGSTSTHDITINGNVNSSNNTTAGIYVFSDNATSNNTIKNVSIGASGSIVLSNNGSVGVSYSGGAGVLIYGAVTNTTQTITANFTKGTAPGGGLLVLGNTTTGGSPSGIVVSGSIFTGYSSTYYAIALNDGSHGDKCPNNVTASSHNIFTGASTTTQIGALVDDQLVDGTLGLVQISASLLVQIKVFLQGPYSGGSMSTALATAGSIPTSQPYGNAPFSYSGGENVASTSVFTSNNITDWILVELRSTSNGAAVDRRAALLKNDGTVLDVDGSTGIAFATATSGSYFIVIKHRNHLAVMSTAAVSLPNGSVYDFTTPLSQAYYTSGLNAMATLSSGVYGMWCGDTDASGVVDNGDRVNTWNNRNATGVYSGNDTDLSGVVDNQDRVNTWNNRNTQTQVP